MKALVRDWYRLYAKLSIMGAIMGDQVYGAAVITKDHIFFIVILQRHVHVDAPSLVSIAFSACVLVYRPLMFGAPELTLAKSIRSE